MPPPTEQSPLLNGHPPQRSLYQSVIVLVKAEGEPSWLASYRWFIFGSWLNLLLLLVPIAAASHYLNWDAPLRFGFSFVAIIPLAKVRTGHRPSYPALTRFFSVTRRCHRADVSVPWTNPCGLVKRYLWKRSRNHCRCHSAPPGGSPNRPDFREYPTRSPCNTRLPRADAWLYPIEHSLGSGLFLPCWYVGHSGMNVCTHSTDHI